jgi:hypothetical protein
LDDKILAAWNGLMLASLAEAARVLDRKDYRTAAVRNGEFLLNSMRREDGTLYRTHKNGVSKISGYLEDYAGVIDGLLELYQATFDEKWFIAARQLADVVLARFAAQDGGFFDTADNADALIVRPRNVQDNATPSGNTLMAKQLLRLAAYTGDARYDDAARAMLRLLTEAMRQFPQAFGEALNASDLLVKGIAEVAVVGSPEDAQTKELLDVVNKPYRPNVILALAENDVEGETTIPLLNYRVKRGGKPTVYVCRHFVCQMPVTSAEEVNTLL